MRSEELAKLTRVVHKHKVKVSTERSDLRHDEVVGDDALGVPLSK